MGSATSNHIIGNKRPATWTRFLRLFWNKTSGNHEAFQQLSKVKEDASGGFQHLLKLRYYSDAINVITEKYHKLLAKDQFRLASVHDEASK